MNKIMVVDDIELNVLILKALLEGNGYGVETAKDGAEALKIARSTKLDLIISDILMPIMDGFTLCRQWKKDDQLKNIPFIIYTATYKDSKDEKLALSLGAERFIIKPAEPNKFIEIVKDILKQYEAGKLAPPGKLVNDEEVFLKKYNEVLIHKLEDKMLSLEQANQILNQKAHDLGERVKELNCLYNITKLADIPEITVEEMIQGTVDLIPHSYQYPDVTSVRIKLYDDVISSSNFKESEWKQTSDILVKNQPVGIVEVVYLEEKPESDEGPFLKEERSLINGISKQLGKIIERVQAEDALIESEEQYRVVVEDSPGIISRYLPDGTITFVNQEYCRFFGKEYDQVIGTNIQSTIPKEDRESVMSGFASLSLESPIRSIEIKNIKHNNEIRWIRWTDHALFNDKGQVKSYQSIGEDITESKRSEQALRLEQEKAQKYLDIAEVMILALNSKGEISLINQKGNKILGYKKDELLGKNWFETCIPALNRKKRRQYFRKVMAGEVELVEYNENTILTKTGEERIIAWQDTVLWDEKGHNVETLSSGEDITERKLANEEIIKLNAELEQRVVKRTAQLEVANRELESFSYSVSHDLRAPLRTMSVFSNLLVDEYGKKLPKEAQHYLGLISESSHKMDNLINDLLLLSRTEKQDLNVQKVSCTEMVKQVVAELQTEREGREVEVVVGRLRTCQADPTLLKQVWVNLLSNAFKFTKGKENALVEIGSKTIKGEKVYFVKDNGVGFDMRYADKLFNVFQRLHSAKEYEGTGVGLAIVQRIITRHGGKVWAEAEVNKGAVFFFTVGEIEK